jgi:hypothetical protein
MQSFGHILANVQNSTPLEKHRRKRGPRGETFTVSELNALESMGLDLDRLMEACRKRKADPHDVIARALSEEAEADCDNTGMTLKAQADLAWKLVDKAVPSKRSVEHSGNAKDPVRFIIES